MSTKLLLVKAVDSQKPLDVQHPALGFGYVASSLREVFGDRITFKVIGGDPGESIKAFQPDIIGITSVSKNYGIAKEYAAIARLLNIPVIIGGVHISFMPQTLTQDMAVGIDGEGEGTIIDLMSSFIANGKFEQSELRDIDGIIFRNNGELVTTKPRDLIKPLEDIPYPARDLLDIHKSAHMLSSRGCPYSCAFCSTARYTRHQVRYAAPEYVVDEIELLYTKYRVEHITIYDDLFAMNGKRVVKIQELLGRRNLIGKFGISVNIRPNFITDALAEVLCQMNVKVVALGVESGCQKTLDYLKSGGLTVEQNATAIRILKQHHIIPYCSFIVGSPDEDWASVMETVKFIEDNGIYYFDMGILTPYPGTPIWDDALSCGLVGDDMDWRRLDFHLTSTPLVLAKHLQLKDMVALHAKLEIRKRHHLNMVNMLLAIRHPIKTMGEILRGVT